jgi:hypothetical protein
MRLFFLGPLWISLTLVHCLGGQSNTGNYIEQETVSRALRANHNLQGLQSEPVGQYRCSYPIDFRNTLTGEISLPPVLE